MKKILFIFLTLIIFPLCTSANAANWWDKFGEPKYGGDIKIPLSSIGMVQFDNYMIPGAETQYWLETLWSTVNWTLDREIWPFETDFTPEKYCTVKLAESWEYTDPKALTVHLRKGVHWQDKPPVNGREFTAHDVEAHYDRMLGTGSGYTSPAPMYVGMIPLLEKATATDKYTVVFRFSGPSGYGLGALMDPIAANTIEAPEWVALGGPPSSGPPKGGPPKGGSKKGGPPPFGSGPLQDWHNAVGTGPWILTDYVAGSAMTFKKNPNYWGHDERYPENRLPYADELKLLVIGDIATQLAALRTEKIDMIPNVPWQQAESLKKTNPDLFQRQIPYYSTSIGLRNDKAPFTDIRVRKALQMAVDIRAIAKGHFGGTVDGTPCGMMNPALKGYAFEYKDWPQSLKDEYAYNPEGAKKLLAEAGYPNGFKTNIAASVDTDVGVLEIIKSYFHDIGVEMDINVMESGTWRGFVGAGKHDQMTTWTSAMVQPPSVIKRFSEQIMSQNPNQVNDPEFNSLVDSFYYSSDPDAFVDGIRKADRMALEKHYVVNLCSAPAFIVWRPNLKGYSGEVQLRWGAAYIYARLWVD